MTDEAYCLRQDERERKTLAHMSRYKKNGSRTNYVQLRQNNMTQKEWKKMNGKVETVSLCKKYNRNEFLDLSKDMRRLYIQHLIDTYGARRIDIARMMGVSYDSVAQMCRKLFDESPFKNEGKGAKPTKAWLDFMAEKAPEKPDPSSDSIDHAILKAPEDAPLDASCRVGTDTAPRKTRASFDNIVLRFSGTPADMLAAAAKAAYMLDGDKDYHVCISIDQLVSCTPALSNF